MDIKITVTKSACKFWIIWCLFWMVLNAYTHSWWAVIFFAIFGALFTSTHKRLTKAEKAKAEAEKATK